jgi:hypothetical protein
MNKTIKLKCSKCGYEREVLSSEMMDFVNCIICDGTMGFIETESKVEIQNETDGIDEVLNNYIIESIKRELESKGEEKVYDLINKMELEKRLIFLEYLFEAKRRLLDKS